MSPPFVLVGLSSFRVHAAAMPGVYCFHFVFFSKPRFRCLPFISSSFRCNGSAVVFLFVSPSFRCNDFARRFLLAFRLHFVATTVLPPNLLKPTSFRQKCPPSFCAKRPCQEMSSPLREYICFPKEGGSKLRCFSHMVAGLTALYPVWRIFFITNREEG